MDDTSFETKCSFEQKNIGVKNMKIDFQDISVFIDYVALEAEHEGISITTLEQLYAYLDDNQSKFIRFETED